MTAKPKTIYTDKYGVKWTDENIEDLITAFWHAKRALDLLTHYACRVKKRNGQTK